MSFATYSDLKTSALDWMDRAGQTGLVADWITLAEARLNAELGPVETTATLTGVVGSNSLSTSALTIVEPINLWLTPATGDDEIRLQMQSPELLSYAATNGRPRQWAYDSEDAIKLDCPCDTAYSFRYRYRGRFALSDSATTNWLLENRPDIYLAATLMWGAGYNQDWPNGSVWKGTLEDELPKVAHTLAKGRKGTLRVDPALSVIGRRGGFNFTTGT